MNKKKEKKKKKDKPWEFEDHLASRVSEFLMATPKPIKRKFQSE